MTYAGGAAAYAAVVANAVKASGSLVKLEEKDFARILEKARSGLVVHASSGVFSTKHQYLVSYKGFTFFHVCREPVRIPDGFEIIEAKSIWMPS